MKIYTITLSPAYDVHASAKSLMLQHENLAHVKSRDAGGKGVNISRALTYNGVENTAIVVLGRDNCADFKSALGTDKMTYIGIEKNGRIRENLTIHTEGENETRISFSGFALDNSILAEIEKWLPTDGDVIITFTGSVPKGVDMPEVKKFLIKLKNTGARVVVDSRSFTLSDLIDVGPWLIKPNSEEIAMYSGKEVHSFADCLDFAKKLCADGIDNVMISLGEKGALLMTAETAVAATPPAINALSTIGAGDSTIAGFIAAYSKGENSAECLRVATSYGTATCLLEGTTPPTPENVAEIYKNVIITTI
ncbi:MAG: hexose kinase [Clostridia bacterium]|nr:hexose kinase [Clostridia bacterium]